MIKGDTSGTKARLIALIPIPHEKVMKLKEDLSCTFFAPFSHSSFKQGSQKTATRHTPVRTRSRARMSEDNTRARLAEMEAKVNNMANLMAEMQTSQSNQLSAMMAEMRSFYTSQGTTSNAATDPKGPTLNDERRKGQIEEEKEEEEEEVPSKASPVVIHLEENKGAKDEAKVKEAMRLAKIEECLVTQGYELERVDSIMPYAKVHVPENYKEPEFVSKYDGTGCPRSHLKYYLRKMARYSDNPPLLINAFQDSLQGAALTWYITLDMEEYQSWSELANEFLRQYKFNVEVLPTREDLVQLKQKMNEGIKVYAQRWRTMASQVKPLIQEEELVELFLRSLPQEYYEKLYVSSSPSFKALLRVAERIEKEFEKKKAELEAERKAHYSRKGKEPSGEIAYVAPTVPNRAQNPRFQQPAWQAPRVYEPRKKAATRQYTPLPRPLSKLLPMLLEGRLVAKELSRDPPPKFFGSDLSKSCEYHMGEKGHDVDNCLILKNRVQDMIDRGMLDFKEAGPAPETLPN